MHENEKLKEQKVHESEKLKSHFLHENEKLKEQKVHESEKFRTCFLHENEKSATLGNISPRVSTCLSISYLYI